MTRTHEAIRTLDKWYASLDCYTNALPAKGSTTAALHVLERLKADFNLDISAHVSEKRAQIKGLSAQSVDSVMSAFGESRTLSAVGGRSNRGTVGDVAALLEMMRPLELRSAPPEERASVLESMQRRIVTEFVPRYFAAERVKAPYNPSDTTYSYIVSLMQNATEASKAGAVAEHLVGAKLAVLYPEKEVRNKIASTKDEGSGEVADFRIGDTAFHVTVAPQPLLYARLRENVENGLHVYLLVPTSQEVGARQNAEALIARRITVESLESFVATNMDEAAAFERGLLKTQLRRLLETYNHRVSEAGEDPSILIDIPPALRHS